MERFLPEEGPELDFRISCGLVRRFFERRRLRGWISLRPLITSRATIEQKPEDAPSQPLSQPPLPHAANVYGENLDARVIEEVGRSDRQGHRDNADNFLALIRAGHQQALLDGEGA